jgi:tetratricopeptide (TPR) repeat protein
MDLSRPAIALCVEGTQLEFQKQIEAARQRYAKAWACATDDYEKCIAAHYVGHLAQTPAEVLFWHQTAVEHANRADAAQVESFRPSLYVNLGYAFAQVGDAAQAKHFYGLAAELGLVHGEG